MRACTNLLHQSFVGSENAVDVVKFLPLPFDFEIEESEKVDVESLIEGYNRLKESGALDG